VLEIIAVFLVVTGLLVYANARFVRLPTTIGVMAIALVLSLAVVVLDRLGVMHWARSYETSLLESIDFSDVLMEGMLSVLLFAGAMHIDLSRLRQRRWQVYSLAFLGTLFSAGIVGLGLWLVLPWAGLQLSLIHCLLFGALISPTDPIAVLAILKSAGAPPAIETVIAGESLLNDGMAIVLFSLLVGALADHALPTAASVGLLFVREVGGGMALGLALGFGVYRLMRTIDDYEVEVLLTLATVIGGYALALHLHVSGPLAMVLCGLVIGNRGRACAMSETTRHYVDVFWELLDDILNAVLFVLIGMEVVVLSFSAALLQAGAAAIVLTLAARWPTVGLPVAVFSESLRLPPRSGRVLTWGGLRGGISVALALSLPAGAERDAIVTLTYCVVVFSILVQGLTISRVVERSFRKERRGGSRNA